MKTDQREGQGGPVKAGPPGRSAAEIYREQRSRAITTNVLSANQAGSADASHRQLVTIQDRTGQDRTGEERTSRT